MSKTMLVELPNGKKLLFGSPEKGGLHEVGLADKLPGKVSGKFEDAMGDLGELVGVLEGKVGALAKRPTKVEMEFGVTLSTEGTLWVVSGKAEAELKVTLTWEADPKAGN